MLINERFRLKTLPVRARLLAMAPMTTLLLATPLLQAADVARGDLAAQEQARRGQRTNEAHALLVKGDESYHAGDWKVAVENYSKAFDLLPASPAAQQLRDAARERLVLGSVQYARDLSRLGDVAGAKTVINHVLEADIAPDHPAAVAMMAELNDPIRTNPALTKEHAADVEEVRLLLYKAEGAYDLGKFDEAKTVYEDVLRTDPTNKAARRGMEKVAQAKANYSRAAYDNTRAEMLAQVDEQWEMKVNPVSEVPESITGFKGDAGKMLLSRKLKAIVLPVLDLDGVTLEEAVDYLRAQSIRYDTFAVNPEDKGINFVVDLGPSEAEPAASIRKTPISLQLKNVPLEDVLKYINDITRTAYSAQDYAVTIRPAGSATGEIVTRTFQVAPSFLRDSAPASSAGNSDDPFGGSSAKPEGLVARPLDPVQALKNRGIPFPDGATASFNSGNSSLRVSNTVDNLLMIEDMLSSLDDSAPAAVTVEVKILKTRESRLKELGFDWLLEGDSLFKRGLENLVLSGGASNVDALSDIPLAAGELNANAVTAGNRSGTYAVSGDSLDALIENANNRTGFASQDSRAPGVLAIKGFLNNTNVTMLMRGLNQKKDVSLAACPSVTVRSGQAAKVELGRELIYPTEYEPPELPNTIGGDVNVDPITGDVTENAVGITPITPSHPTSFEKRTVGMVLDVLPTVGSDNRTVDLAVKPSVTDFDGFVNFGTPVTSPMANSLTGLGNGTVILTPNDILMPVFSTIRTDTNLSIVDGATIVLGGMLQEKIQKVEDQVPILGSLPLVGRFFKSDAYYPEKTAVVILVTVKVVDPGGRRLSNN